ncbi:hypothetical protein [Mucilaginibacter flavidus]|uniref:hypothetical protein n=1 Tax=Mucilaginibacter flavidus TaxID=2949309 RepID=UPI002092F974|nr:hypothetical protein [Mucilaginibacter flavidus]MCO5950769.1 hypothetical protein [Mucilaginibacter flavidus]
MPNIKFNYLYRDAGNHKNYNSLVFANPNNVDIQHLETLIKSKLIEGNWFFANEWKLPDLHFKCWDPEIDHAWHEFESVEYTDELQNVPLSLTELITDIEKTHWYNQKKLLK